MGNFLAGKAVVNDYGVSVDGASPGSAVAEAVVKEIEAAGGEAVAVADDVSTMTGGQRIVDAALTSYGRLDGVVCVAGILRERVLFNMSEQEWDPVVTARPRAGSSRWCAAPPWGCTSTG